MTAEPIFTWGHPPPLPVHPLARRSMVLGLISALGFCLLLPMLLGPFAWYYGVVARREIEREPLRWGGRGEATTGMITGIVGTAMLAIGLLLGALSVTGLILALNLDY